MAIELLTADAPSAAAFGKAQWGIFSDSGGEILTVDAVADVDYARDYRISDYPQEKGAFQSYNKVQVPFQAKVGFYISESRFSFLKAVEKVVKSLEFVTVVTPEIEYASANLTHYGYRREARNGVTLIRVEVWCQEIRIAGTQTEASAQSTNAATPTESGNVQTTPSGRDTFTDKGATVGGGTGGGTGAAAGGGTGATTTDGLRIDLHPNSIPRLPDGTVISDAPAAPG